MYFWKTTGWVTSKYKVGLTWKLQPGVKSQSVVNTACFTCS